MKSHEPIHREEKLVKVMKHPFVSKLGPDSKQNYDQAVLEKIIAPRMDSPFMTRNLPRSMKEKLERPKSKFYYSF